MSNRNFDDGGEVYKSHKKAKWSIIEGNRLKIESAKEYIDGEFEICFGKDILRKSVFIVIKSNDLYLKAYRGNFSEGFNDDLPISCDSAI